MSWVLAAMTIQLYVEGAKGFWIVCGMLVAYNLYFFRRVERTSGAVLWLSLVLALGSFGGIGNDSVKDLFQPLHMGLTALAVLGVFVGEYHRREDATFLAGLFVVLLVVGVWQSIERNNLLEIWEQGGRTGVNLQAVFIMIATSYGFLLPGRWKWVGIPLYMALYLLGSRTSFISALAVPLIYFTINREARKELLHNSPPLSIIVFVVLAAGLYRYLSGQNQIFGFAIDPGRYLGDTLSESAEARMELSVYWLKFLWERPSWFGYGFDSYSARFQEGIMFPHNGFLHVFNGLGVICGVVYLWVCIRVLLGFWKNRTALPGHIVWAGAFFTSMILRKFGEAQLLVVAVHVSGFAIAYAVGLAIWGTERLQANGYISDKMRWHNVRKARSERAV